MFRKWRVLGQKSHCSMRVIRSSTSDGTRNCLQEISQRAGVENTWHLIEPQAELLERFGSVSESQHSVLDHKEIKVQLRKRFRSAGLLIDLHYSKPSIIHHLKMIFNKYRADCSVSPGTVSPWR